MLDELRPDDPRPLINAANSVMIMGGTDHADRLLYALRLSLNLRNGMTSYYWHESEYLSQREKVAQRGKWADRGDTDLINEYFINRMAFEEFESVGLMVFDGLGASTLTSGKGYRFGEVRAVTDFLRRRVTDPACTTIVVPEVTALLDYHDLAGFHEGVLPQFEQFTL